MQPTRLCALLLFACALSFRVAAQEAKYNVPFLRVGASFGESIYAHQFQEEIYYSDSLIYAFDNGGKNVAHGRFGVNLDFGYCFARQFRIGIHAQSCVYTESASPFIGLYSVHSAGPLFEYSFRYNLACFARVTYAWDTQYRFADRRSAWRGGIGLLYRFADYPRCGIRAALDYFSSKGNFENEEFSEDVATTGGMVTHYQTIENKGAVIEVGLFVEW